MAGPKELKRQRERERYALNMAHKKATSTILNAEHTPSRTHAAISLSPGLSIIFCSLYMIEQSEV